MARSKLIFVYRKSRINVGTTRMRAHQLGALLRPAMPEMAISMSRIGRRGILQRLWAQTVPRGAAVFLTKHVAGTITPETLAILKRRDCAVLADLVDMRFDRLPPVDPNVDVYLCASSSGVARLRDALRARGPTGAEAPRVRSLIHAADLRLYDRRTLPSDQLRPVYWGDARHAMMTDAIAARVPVLDASDAIQAERSLGLVSGYNMHYCVRPTVPYDCIKPFTKGANAAMLGAPVLVNRQVQDAVELLGEDYPYLIDAPQEATILAALDRARDGFGGAEWDLARARMADLADRVSPAAIAGQLREILREIGRE